jgi:CRP-like cAMP-binding protein
MEVVMFLRKEIIARVPFLRDAPKDIANDLVSRLHLIVVNAGEVIMQCGEQGSEMYIINRGEVTVEIEGVEHVGRIMLGDGDFFGEKALLEKCVRTATVRATRASELLMLSRNDLGIVLDGNREFAKKVISQLKKKQGNDRSSRTSIAITGTGRHSTLNAIRDSGAVPENILNTIMENVTGKKRLGEAVSFKPGAMPDLYSFAEMDEHSEHGSSSTSTHLQQRGANSGSSAACDALPGHPDSSTGSLDMWYSRNDARGNSRNDGSVNSRHHSASALGSFLEEELEVNGEHYDKNSEEYTVVLERRVAELEAQLEAAKKERQRTDAAHSEKLASLRARIEARQKPKPPPVQTPKSPKDRSAKDKSPKDKSPKEARQSANGCTDPVHPRFGRGSTGSDGLVVQAIDEPVR